MNLDEGGYTSLWDELKYIILNSKQTLREVQQLILEVASHAVGSSISYRHEQKAVLCCMLAG